MKRGRERKQECTLRRGCQYAVQGGKSIQNEIVLGKRYKTCAGFQGAARIEQMRLVQFVWCGLKVSRFDVKHVKK
jgi:hypothetical protein